MAEQKRYVVREGKQRGIFDNWNEVQTLVSGFPWAKYKSFKTLGLAQLAYQEWWEKYYQPEKKRFEKEIPFVKQSIAVDAASSSATGMMEYQGIDLLTGNRIFHEKYQIWTNNIGEFLAIVHACSYLKKANKTDYVVYSDSKIAMKRVMEGKCKTNLIQNAESQILFDLIKRAENWIAQNGIPVELLKWKTSERWEIPADFGRK